MTNANRELLELFEFIRWTADIQARIGGQVARLARWKQADRAIASGGFGPFDLEEGDIELAVSALERWTDSAVLHCAEIKGISGYDYDNLVFVEDFDGRMVNLMPMMEAGPPEDRQRYGEVAAFIVRPDRDLYRFYGSNLASWQRWKDQERLWKEDPDADVILLDDAGWFETEGKPGRTYYVPQ